MRTLVLLVCLTLCAKEPCAQVTPLSIGDKFPDIQLTGVFNYKDTAINFSNLRGKAILLDFWSNWCASCLEKMPELQKIQNTFQSGLQIFTVNNFSNKEDAKKRLQQFKFTKNLRLPCITDTILSKLFIYNSIPHEVIIDKNGIVTAITYADYINEKNIGKFLKGEKVFWRPKVSDEFDPSSGLLIPQNNSVRSPIFYTALTGYYIGDENGSSKSITTLMKDSLSQVAKSIHFNVSILALYRRTLTEEYKDQPEVLVDSNRVVVEAKDSSRFFNKNESAHDWNIKNLFCYEAVLPLNTNQLEFDKMMRADLDKFLSLKTYWRCQDVPCFVIEKKSNRKLSANNVNKGIQTIEQLRRKILWKYRITVVDETGFAGTLEKEISSASVSNLTQLRKELNEQGYDIVKTKRKMMVFVITDRNNDVKN